MVSYSIKTLDFTYLWLSSKNYCSLAELSCLIFRISPDLAPSDFHLSLQNSFDGKNFTSLEACKKHFEQFFAKKTGMMESLICVKGYRIKQHTLFIKGVFHYENLVFEFYLKIRSYFLLKLIILIYQVKMNNPKYINNPSTNECDPNSFRQLKTNLKLINTPVLLKLYSVDMLLLKILFHFTI